MEFSAQILHASLVWNQSWTSICKEEKKKKKKPEQYLTQLHGSFGICGYKQPYNFQMAKIKRLQTPFFFFFTTSAYKVLLLRRHESEPQPLWWISFAPLFRRQLSKKNPRDFIGYVLHEGQNQRLVDSQ